MRNFNGVRPHAVRDDLLRELERPILRLIHIQGRDRRAALQQSSTTDSRNPRPDRRHDPPSFGGSSAREQLGRESARSQANNPGRLKKRPSRIGRGASSCSRLDRCAISRVVQSDSSRTLGTYSWIATSTAPASCPKSVSSERAPELFPAAATTRPPSPASAHSFANNDLASSRCRGGKRARAETLATAR